MQLSLHDISHRLWPQHINHDHTTRSTTDSTTTQLTIPPHLHYNAPPPIPTSTQLIPPHSLHVHQVTNHPFPFLTHIADHFMLPRHPSPTILHGHYYQLLTDGTVPTQSIPHLYHCYQTAHTQYHPTHYHPTHPTRDPGFSQQSTHVQTTQVTSTPTIFTTTYNKNMKHMNRKWNNCHNKHNNKMKLHKKLHNQLIDNSIINLADTPLTKSAPNLLSKGLKFIPSPKPTHFNTIYNSSGIMRVLAHFLRGFP